MSFIVSPLPFETFQPLFGLSDEALAEHGVVRRTVDAHPGFPCRVTLEDAAIGETVLLINYVHQPANTPFRASHAIYVREQGVDAGPEAGVIPTVLRRRAHISLRAFDDSGMMVGARIAPGATLEPRSRPFWLRRRSPICTPTTPRWAATRRGSTAPEPIYFRGGRRQGKALATSIG